MRTENERAAGRKGGDVLHGREGLKKVKNILVATININRKNEPVKRIKIVCRREADGVYRWYGPSNDDLRGTATEDAGVAGNTLRDAQKAACAAWSNMCGGNWDLRATWIS
jgi:hypothetical protein